MCLCWSQDPSERPSAVDIRRAAGCAQFCHLADAVSLDITTGILTACSVSIGYGADTESEFGKISTSL